MIHNSSVIDPKAQIGDGVKIGPFCFVGPKVQISNDVELVSNVHIEGNTKIGKGTKIFPFASIGTAPQDLKYKGEVNSLEIGENNIIREYVTINPGTEGGGGKTKVGNNCLLMISSHIAHDCNIGNNVVVANNVSAKPEVKSFLTAMKDTLSLEDPKKVCMVGDNYVTDGGAVEADGTIGAVLVDEGMFVVTSSTMREVATAVTAVKYRTNVLNTTISVFCKCSPDALNFTLNPSSYSISSISASTDPAIGEIGQSFNNILANSTITASTDRAQYLPGLVSSGAGWSPYITTVGLYNHNNDLLAVAKVATPLKKPNDLPLTFKVQIDV